MTLLSEDKTLILNTDKSPLLQILSASTAKSNLNLTFKITAILLIFTQAMLINFVSNQYHFLGKTSFMPGMIFIILTANLYNYQYLHGILVANIFFIIAWWLVADIYNHTTDNRTVFNASLLLSAASLFYLSYTYFLIFLMVAVLFNVKSNLKDVMMIVLGFLTVWYIYFGLSYVISNNVNFSEIINDLTDVSAHLGDIKCSMLAFSIYITLLSVIGISTIILNLSLKKVFIRLNIRLLIVWVLTGMLIWLTDLSSKEIFYSIAIPLSVLLSIYFTDMKNKFMREVFWLLFISMTIINQIFGC